MMDWTGGRTALVGPRLRGSGVGARLRIVASVGLAVLAACGSPPPGYGIPPALPQGAIAHTRERTYEVEGLTRDELLQQLRARGPRVGGRSVWGSHDWSVRWRFRYAPNGGRCRMTDVRVELNSTTTLPIWTAREGSEPSLIQAWDDMLEGLRIHENGHRDIAHRAARDVLRTLRSLRTSGCASMTARANAAAERILERYRGLDRRYDEETEAGVLQGATLAPSDGVPLPSRVEPGP